MKKKVLLIGAIKMTWSGRKMGTEDLTILKSN